MKRLWALLVLVCAACAPADRIAGSPTVPSTPAPTPWPTPWPEAEKAKTYVLNHIWYRSGKDTCPSVVSPALDWSAWVWSPKIDDPCMTIPGAPWLREVSGPAYPLTGPYDSRNEDILRWQIRQAKAAGIDGFFVPLYSWAPHLAYLHDVFFGTPTRKGFLQIAHEEKFQLGIEDWTLGAQDRPQWNEAYLAAVERQVAAIQASPYREAYIHVSGRPAIWLIYPDWMPQRERIQFFDGTAKAPRNITWLIRHAWVEYTVELNGWMTRSQAQYVSSYDFPSVNGWILHPDFEVNLVRAGERTDLGMIRIAHAYIGYDERPGKVAGPYYGRYGLRNGTSFMAEFLEKAVTAGAVIILLESWNEWGEGSTIEAGVNISQWRHMGQERDLYLDEQNRDAPYRYLDAIRRFNGMQEWVPPEPPPCSAVDPLMRVRHQTDLPDAMRCRPDAESSDDRL